MGYTNKVSVSELWALKLGLSPFCILLILGSVKDSDICPCLCLGLGEDSLIWPLLLLGQALTSAISSSLRSIAGLIHL